MARIMVADDDRAIREALSRAFRLAGHDVIAVADGDEVIATYRQEQVDLYVLDIMMPHLDGVSTCRLLRQNGITSPIMVLTALDTVTDKVAGLDAGADDYLSKPFELDELMARIRALLRRPVPAGAAPSVPSSGDILTVADLSLDRRSREVTRGDRFIELSRTEFQLLELLMRHPGEVLEPHRIYEEIWGYDFGPNSKNLAVYISYLRRKIELDDEPRLIHNRRGMGYVLREP